MNGHQATKLADDALGKLAVAIDRGESGQLKAYLAVMARFHRYSVSNLLLISAQRPDASRVAGFGAWKKLGRFVKKGEKGIAIIAPIVTRRGAGVQRDDDEERVVRFKAVHVFDISQTEGEPLVAPACVGGDPRGCTGRIKALLSAKGIELEYSDQLGSAAGASCGGKILLRPGLSSAEEFSVLVHELAHEMLHGGDDRSSKLVRETEAETVAYVVCESVGLDTNTASSDYIGLYGGDRATLTASLGRIQRAAVTIIDSISESRDNATPAAPRGGRGDPARGSRGGRRSVSNSGAGRA